MPSSPIKQACRNKSGKSECRGRAALQQPGQADLAHAERQLAKNLAVASDQNIESVELDLMIVLAAVQPVEVAVALNPEQYSLAIEDERAARVTECGPAGGCLALPKAMINYRA
jgi:hypothetical protein